MTNPKVFLVFLVLPLKLVSQHLAFESAYYIDNAGERHSGWINDINGSASIEEYLEFRETENGAIEQLYISDVQVFGYQTGERYERQTVFVNKWFDHKLAPRSTDRQAGRHQLFLQKLVQGASDLYQFRDRDMDYYFYSSATRDSLVYAGYPMEMDQVGLRGDLLSPYQLNIPRFRDEQGELSTEMPRYREHAMIRYFQRLSREAGVEPVVLKRNTGPSTFLHLQAEMARSTLQASQLSDEQLHFVFGTYLEFGVGKLSKKIRIPFELSYSNYTLSDGRVDSIEFASGTRYYPKNIRYEISTIDLGFGARVLLSDAGSLRPFVACLVRMPIASDVQGGGWRVHTGPDYPLRTIELNPRLLLELGVEVGRLRMFIRRHSALDEKGGRESSLGGSKIRQYSFGSSFRII
ncbi:MAG: hypothetical protein AAF433_10720 [Bacteroidota bacterium]